DCGASNSIVTAPARPPTNMPTKTLSMLFVVGYSYSWFSWIILFSPYSLRMTATCGLCNFYDAGLKALDQFLFAPWAIKINTCFLLLFFRQPDKTCQPFDDTGKD